MNSVGIPVTFREFLEAADALVSQALDGLEFHALVEATERVRVPLTLDLDDVKRRHEDYLRATRLAPLFASMLGEGAEKKKYLLFKNLMEILVPLRRYGLSRFTMGLRFPVAGTDDEVAHQASFWVQLASRIAGAGDVLPVLFWTARSDAGRSVLVFLRPPSVRCFLQLLRPDIPSDGIDGGRLYCIHSIAHLSSTPLGGITEPAERRASFPMEASND